jgi:peptide/nickel transport system substrate-binding protein
MATLYRLVLVLVVTSVLMACGSTANPSSTSPGQPEVRTAPKILQLGDHYEPDVLASKYVSTLASTAKRLVNAGLTIIDGRGEVQPYLAENVPQLNSDTWRVFPDGRMETTYRLRPGLTWHDGTPLSVEDYALAFRIYGDLSLGVFGTAPQDRIEQVLTPDDRTIVIQWRTPTLDAGALDTAPLPRHLIAQPYADLQQGIIAQDTFLNLPYWRGEFVGLGPFRLTRWEPGAFVEGEAFAGHVLGRPKVDRVVVRSVPDENTMLTNVLAGQFHFTTRLALRFEHALILQREWQGSQRGTVNLDPVQPRHTQIQARPDYVNPPALTDLRVKRAIAHGLDKQAIMDGLFEGQISFSDSFVPRTAPHFAELDRVITRYPRDLRRVEALMNEAGYRKGSDGMYVNGAGERFAFEHMSIAGNQNERQAAIMGASWREAGFDVKETVLPAALSGDGEARGSFPGLSSVGSGGFDSWATVAISLPSNRWRGGNRGGFSHPSYDALYERYLTSLDRSERNRLEIEMMKVATEQVGGIFLYHNPDVLSYLNPLKGPGPVAPEASPLWNVHEWELQ